MSAALAFACGLAGGWFGRRAYSTWRSQRAVRMVLQGLNPGIIQRAP